MDHRIEKRIELKAPLSRVWRALTDHREFGEWFRGKLDGPFVPGQISRGQITYPGYEHVKWEAVVQKMEPERLFSFTWPHYRPRAAPCSCSRNQASTKSPATGASKYSAVMMAVGQSR